MEKELIVDVGTSEIVLALQEDGRLVELNKESLTSSEACHVGDLYLGKVKKVLPALNAAFVDIGDSKEAFIHYLDLGLNFRASDYFVKQLNPNRNLETFYSSIKIGPILEKEGKIDEVLTPGQSIIVQIVKEPISTKGARLTAEISMVGRNVILLPFSEKISISKKISSRGERKRLERLVRSILPKNYGVIIRTAAEGKTASELDQELSALINKWRSGYKKLVASKAPKLLATENSKTTTLLRDLLNDSFSSIMVNDPGVYSEIKNYIREIAPEKEKIVKLYDGKKPIFDAFDITRQIKSSFGKIVPIKQGAYLIIEHTEALYVVDVNSGTRVKKGVEQQENIYEVNTHAAEEIARQIRLRDIGGIVIVDFIDMADKENRTKLYNHMIEVMQGDRAKHTILPLSKFGLMQITRQRVRPATEIVVNEQCPMCHGTGEISPSIIVDKAIERQLSYYVKERDIKSFILKLNPVLEAYLTKRKGLFHSIVKDWCRKYSCTIKTVTDSDFTLLQSQWLSSKGEPLDEE